MAARKIKEKALEDVALVAGTQQNLRNLYFLDIYDKSGNLDIYGTKPGQRIKKPLTSSN
jgi:hypothetical protein